MTTPRGLVPRRPPVVAPPGADPITIAGSFGAVVFAGLLGGPLWAGFTLCVGSVFCYANWQQARQLASHRQHQENMAHFLHGQTTPEDLARLKGEADVADKELYAFLESIKATYGGESTRGSGRLSGEEQLEAVSPGVTLQLAHDLGYWYAKLVFSGDTGRKFLNGEYTQWRARGRTPAEAVENVIKKCGASRQQRMIQEYAAKMVRGDAD